jgi:hypothetical protein
MAMKRRTWLVIAVLALGLALAAALLAQRFVELSPLRRQIEARLSKSLNGTVELSGLRLALLPSPRVIIDGVRLDIPERLSGTVESVTAYPELLPLVRGVVKLSKLRLVGPDLAVQAPLQPPASGEEAAGSLADAERTAASALARLSAAVQSQAPDLVVTIKNGRVALSGNGPRLPFEDIYARVALPPGRADFELECASGLWKELSLDGSLDAATFVGEAHLTLSGLKAEELRARFSPDVPIELGDSTVGFDIRLALQGFGNLKAEIDGSLPSLTITRGGQQLEVRGDEAKLGAAVAGKSLQVDLHSLRLDSPQLKVSGSFLLDPAGKQVKLSVQGEHVDVASVRNAALFLAGGQPVVQAIFDVLRGGTVPQISVNSHAAALSELGGDEALVINGTLVDGLVHVPGAGLDLEDVRGNATVEHGDLVGRDLSARLGNSKARDGSLRVGLSGGAAPLSVNAQVEGDAADVPPLLVKLVPSPALTRELSRISDVQGSASGTLQLGGTTDDVIPSLDLSTLQVSGSVRGSSQRLSVKGGTFSLQGQSISVAGLAVTWGGSSLSQVGGRIGWSAKPTMEVGCKTSTLILGELHPWLKASGWVSEPPWGLKAVKGTVDVESIQLSGRLDAPSDWRLQAAGSVSHLQVESSLIPDWIEVRDWVSISQLRVDHNPVVDTTVSGAFSAPGGLSGFFDTAWNAEQFDLRQLHIRDGRSDATLALMLKKRELQINFRGNLQKETVDALITKHEIGGWLRGDLRAHVLLDRPMQSTAEGKLQTKDFILRPDVEQSPRITQANFAAGAGKLTVDSAIDTGVGERVQLTGTVLRAKNGFVTDLAVSTDHVDLDQLRDRLGSSGVEKGLGEETGEKSPPRPWDLPLRGTIRASIGSLVFQGYTWKPVRAVTAFRPQGPVLDVTQANVCGIDTPATITFAPLTVSARPAAKNQDFDAALSCLFDDKGFVSGRYGLTANLSAREDAEPILASLRGTARLDAEKGRIHRFELASKIFSVLSIATGSFASLPDLKTEGLPYDTIQGAARIERGKLILDQGVLDGPSVKAVCKGNVDLARQRLDLTFLVAPLKTVDTVISHIPVLGGVVGGSLTSVPVRVTGSFAHPDVTPLSASAVGKELMGMMKRTLKLPFRVISPLLPGKGE